LLSGTISGAGTLIKDTSATSTLTLTGNNSYSGATTIGAGTLQIGNGGTSGTLGTAAVTDNAALVFNRSDDVTVANAISGSGTVTKSGSNTLTLTANGSYSGVTTISGGTLVLSNNAPTTGSSSFAGPGAFRIEPTSNDFTSAFSTSGWTLGSTLGGLTIGKASSADGASDVAVTIPSAISIAGPISIYGGNITLNAGLTANAITLKASGNVTDGASGYVSASNLLLLGGNVTLSHADNAIGTLAASGVGSLTYVDKDALTLGTVGSTNGVSAGGAVSIGTKTGDLTVAQNVATTNATVSALTLNAGIDAAAGTSTGGNLILSNSPTISVGSGGIGKLYAGSISGSTGLTGLTDLASGSGRFRYNSDESATNYTAALVTGLNAIYREQPATTVAVGTTTMTYGDTLPTLGTASNLVNGDTARFDITGRVNSTSGNIQYNATPYAVTNTNLAALGYSVTGAASGALTVTQRTLTLTGFIANSKEYNGNTTATFTAPSLNGVVGSDTVNVSNSGATFSDKNVGTGKTVTLNGVAINGTDAGNYSIDSTSLINSADITARTVTLSASKTYDGTTGLTGNVTVGTGVNGENLTYTGATASDAHVATASNYINAITLGDQVGASASSGGLVSNYQLPTLNAANAPLTITAATLTPTLSNSGVSKTYDGTTNAPGGFTPTYSFSGLVSGDTATLTTATGVAYNSKDVATANLVTVSGLGIANITGSKGSLASDYVLDTTSKTVSATITKAPLTVRANDDANFVTQTKTGTDTYAGVSYSGFVGGETQSSSGVLTAGTIARTSNLTTAATCSGDLVPSGWSAANYAVSYTNGNYTIVPANQLLVKVTPVQNTYGTVTTYTVSEAKYLASDGSTITDLTNSFARSGTNNNTITITDGTSGTASFTLAPASGANSTADKLKVGSYQLAASGAAVTTANFSNTITVVGSHQVDAKGLAAFASSGVSKVYDGTTSINGVTVGLSGLENNGATPAVSDVVTVNGIGAFGSKNAGSNLSYTISNLALSGSDAGNYYLSGGGDLSGSNGAIDKANATVTANSSNVTYNGLTQSVSGFTATGLVVGESASVLSGVSASGTGKNAGSYDSVATGTDANYNLTFVKGTLAIDPAALSVTANNASKTYDGVAYTGGNGVAYSGFVDSETSSVLGGTLGYAGTSQGAKNAGSYLITPQGLTSANYAVSFVDGSLTISAAGLSAIVGSLTGTTSKVYDGNTTATLAPGNFAFTGFASGEGASVTKTSGSYDTANAGTGKTVTVNLSNSDYAATGSTLLSNYTLPTSVSGSIGTITQAPLSVSGLTA
jgi:autotransporter-associated beta strand protein